MHPCQHICFADIWRSFLMSDLIWSWSQKDEAVYFGFSRTSPWSYRHFSGTIVLIFNPHRENLKPDWQRYKHRSLAKGRQELFTNEIVKIKYPDTKRKVFFSPCQLSRLIPNCFIQHFAKYPVILFRWKIQISPLFYSSVSKEIAPLFKKGWKHSISNNEILVTDYIFGRTIQFSDTIHSMKTY